MHTALSAQNIRWTNITTASTEYIGRSNDPRCAENVTAAYARDEFGHIHTCRTCLNTRHIVATQTAGSFIHGNMWRYRLINLRPYYAEGSKTLGFEVAEQLGWRAPDVVVAPAASGLLFTRIWKGLNELSLLGLIEPVDTHMHVAQAAGSSPIVNAFDARSLHVHPVTPDTLAKSIAVGNPADGPYAVKTARESGGRAWSATDEEILEGIKLLAQTEGIFAEAAGGTTIAVLKKMAASGAVSKDQVTVAMMTGAGPKTQEVVADVVQPVFIQPTLESFDAALGQLV